MLNWRSQNENNTNSFLLSTHPFTSSSSHFCPVYKSSSHFVHMDLLICPVLLTKSLFHFLSMLYLLLCILVSRACLAQLWYACPGSNKHIQWQLFFKLYFPVHFCFLFGHSESCVPLFVQLKQPSIFPP